MFLLLHSQILQKAKIVCCSDALTKADEEAPKFNRAESPQEALQMALKERGRKSRIGNAKCGEMLPSITSHLKIMKKARV